MLQPYRHDFNTRQFTPERYAELKRRLSARTRTDIQFRICETPCFFPADLLAEMAETGRILTRQLIDSPEYMRRSDSAIPERYRVPNDNPRPNFMTVDFGLVRGEDGRITPKLVELQAFPSIFGYQQVSIEEYCRVYELAPELNGYLGGLDTHGYLGVAAGHDRWGARSGECGPSRSRTRRTENATRLSCL